MGLLNRAQAFQNGSPPPQMASVRTNPLSFALGGQSALQNINQSRGFAPQPSQAPWMQQQQGYQPQITAASMGGGGGGGDMMNIMRMFGLGG